MVTVVSQFIEKMFNSQEPTECNEVCRRKWKRLDKKILKNCKKYAKNYRYLVFCFQCNPPPFFPLFINTFPLCNVINVPIRPNSIIY